MRKSLILVLAMVALLSCVLAGKLFTHSKPIPRMPHFSFEEFITEWKQIDSLEQAGQPRSALEIVQTIYAKAKAENNTGQLVKAVIYKLKFTSYIEEDALVLSLIDLKKEAVKAPFPARNVLHSMLAEMYWNYYQQNRYRFLNRSATVDFEADDIRTWDLQKVVEGVKQHYFLSLEERNSLVDTPVDVYQAILQNGANTRELRPTLYDFLAQRAVNFFMQSEPGLTQPADQFLIGEEYFFAPAKQFASQNITTTDTLNFKFQAIRLLQDLLRFRTSEDNLEALIELDLQRLGFVHQYSIHPQKDVLYRQALEALEKQNHNNPVSTTITHRMATHLYDQSQNYNPLQNDAHKWEAKQAYRLCREAISRFPDSGGAQDCRSLQSQIQERSIKLTFEKINLPNEDFRGLVSFKNVDKLYFRVIKTNREEFEKIHSKDDYSYSNEYKEKIIRFYAAKKALHEFSVSLPIDGDYQNHAAEVKMPAAPLGDYIILAGTDPSLTYTKNAVAYDFITISSLSYINRSRQSGETELYVMHRKTGAPLPNVTAQVLYSEYNHKSNRTYLKKHLTLQTDKDGYVKIPRSQKHSTYTIEFTHGNDQLITMDEYNRDAYSNTFHNYGSYPRDTASVTKTFYFTDRAIYRPGQPIYFKGILLDTDGRKKNNLRKKQPIHLALYDVNNQEVASLKLVTNEFGTFSGTFTAPSSGLNGNMRIADSHGSTYFSVEEYKRPKFSVEISPVKGTFRLTDEVTVKGTAHAYSGATIDNAQVQYRVVRKANFPYWWYCWRGYYPSSPAVEITNGVTHTDETGEFAIAFNAIPDYSVPEESRPSYTYTIYADVTDQNGETRSSERNVTIGYAALKVSTVIPAILEKEDKSEFSIQTTNLDGEFEAAQGSIHIYQLQTPTRTFRPRLWSRPDTFILSREEFYTSFPDDVYDDENNLYQWAKQTRVLDEKFDTGKRKTFTLAALKKWKPGSYLLEVRSTDKFGQEAKEVVYFTVVDKSSKSLPFATADWFNVLKGNGEPGEKATLLIGASATTSVLYEIEKDNRIISKQWLSLDNEQTLVEIPLTEEYRGNIGVHYTFIHHNRLYTHSTTIGVPYTNKKLDVSFETFRNKLLPGEKESWKVRIRGKQGEKVAAEMVATLYDASLDAFRANQFNFDLYTYCYASLAWNSADGFEQSEALTYSLDWNQSVGGHYKYYDALNWFNFSVHYYDRHSRYRAGGALSKSKRASTDEVESESLLSAPAPALAEVVMADSVEEKRELAKEETDVQANAPTPKSPDEPVKARTNFNETAFFYPHLETDANGDVLISFTVPEALTKWKMLGFAHTTDLKYGFATNELVTQKDLMISSSAPRFLREGDAIQFTSKVNNLSAKDLEGTATLELFDAITMKPVPVLFNHVTPVKSFTVKKGQSAGVTWDLKIPEGVEAVTYRVTARAGGHSDGEEMAVPILTNRMLVTESLPLSVRSKGTKTFTLEKLAKNDSPTLRNHNLTLEFTANPAWYAVQALPYLMEYPYACAEQTFSRLYANSLAAHIANTHPKIKRVFDNWKNTDSGALQSNLAKNQELKALLLEETPWVLEAQNETERKKRMGLLFDLNRMANEQQQALTKLEKMQQRSGGWPWFEGMRESWYITQHIVAGLGHLDHLKVKMIREDTRVDRMTKAALGFMDEALRRQYEEVKRLAKDNKSKLSDNHLGYMEIHYLYARSFFTDVPVAGKSQEAFEYYKGQAKTYWLGNNKYMQGMIALSLFRYNEKTIPAVIVTSLREHALVSEEMGMYWKNDAGFYWYQAPVETQALLIEVFDEVAADQKSVDAMKVWLLKQKQTQDWQTTKATAEACYALLLTGGDWLASDTQPDITVGMQHIDPQQLDTQPEAGTGYFKTSWPAAAITPEMGTVTVSKKDAGVSWGALYWQYFEQLDKITPHATPLGLKKQLFLQKVSATGPVLTPIHEKTQLHPGDLIKVRIELRVDRDMEYVHMKDMRASAFEPTNVLSQYKYQDGLGYYESTRDAATNFFFDYLPKGTYVFEYPLRVTHAGDFSNGVTSIQCMYAPEFTSHSQGIRVRVEERK